MSSFRASARDHLKPLNEDSCLGVSDDLWEALNAEFRFTVDACSSDSNAKLPRHWTAKDDGLSQKWNGERVWCHPLFDRNIVRWIEKGARSRRCTAVYLLPASTDTRWFSIVWNHKKHRPRRGWEVRFLPKRLKYKPAKRCAAFASCIVIKRRRRRK